MAGARTLYAVSTNGFEESAKRERHNAVVRYDLKKVAHLAGSLCGPEMQLNDRGGRARTGRFTRPIRQRHPVSQETR